MTHPLHKQCLAYVPLTRDEVEQIYRDIFLGRVHDNKFKRLCMSHERLRQELAGAETLLNEWAEKLAKMHAETIELNRKLARKTEGSK